VMNHLKKSNRVLFVNPAYAFMPSTELVLKADEMWSFVGKKKVPQWLWWVEDNSNGQIVAFTFGRRINATFRRLKKMLVSVTVTSWITDQWIASQDCLIPKERIATKAELQSLERKHLTLRTRIKMLTLITICFSKSETIHKTIIGLFINHYFFGLNQHFNKPSPNLLH
jgi:insertion element IS1 protein InsB